MSLVLVILVLVPVLSWASHPFVVENTDMQGKGNHLFETNVDYHKDGELKSTDIDAIFTSGISNRTDIVVEVPYRLLDPSPNTGRYAQGLGNILLKLKQRTYSNEVNQSVAYQTYLEFPTGSTKNGLGRDNVIVGIQLMDQQGCCDTIYHAGIGFETYVKNITRWRFIEYNSLRYGFAVERKIFTSSLLLAEIAGETRVQMSGDAGERKTSNPFTGMLGLKRDMSKTWYLDFAIRIGLNKEAMDNSILAGSAWRF